MSLTEVLPTEPVMPTTRHPSSRRQARANPWRAASGSSAARTQPPPSRAASAPTPARPPRPSPRLERRRRVFATLGALAAEAEEQVVGLDLARVGHRPRRAPVPAGADDLGPAGRRDPIGRELDQASDPLRSRWSSSIAT